MIFRRRRSLVPPNRVVAAAVATAGAGGALAWHLLRRHRRAPPSRAYRLEPGEPVPSGMRRIVRGQLDSALEELAASDNGSLPRTVHETRKRLKRIRSALRLAQDGISDAARRSENAGFRDTGRRLSSARDTKVLIDTLDALDGRFPELRARLEREHNDAVRTLRREDTLRQVRRELETARGRTAALDFESTDRKVLTQGLRRIYRRGRRRMKAAKADPTTETLHEWRKRVKDLWYGLQILGDEREDPAHRLSELLGEEHDLGVLRERADGDAVLEAAIDRRRESLQRDAFALGRKVYKRRPRKFAG